MNLSDRDRAFYEWQLDVPGFGEEGQAILRQSTALVSRIGGLGGPIALELAAAGIGRLILIHGGNLEPSDLNRQILMRHEDLGKPRVESARKTLQTFNPHIEVEIIDSHMTAELAREWVTRADMVFDAAPRFPERYHMNTECVRQKKPLIDAAMFNLEGQVIPIVPGVTPCLACLYPEEPPHWRRRFPVIGAVSALIGNIAVMEGIKLLTGLGTVALNQMIYVNTSDFNIQKIAIARNPECRICGKTNDPARS
ncbi:MAG: HesA/MoeB/ThiF family protein [Verrucomicrobiota bacterium]